MDSDLEKRWQDATGQKNLSSTELKAMVEEMERKVTIPHNWNRKCEESIRKERAEFERRYSIRIGQLKSIALCVVNHGI